MSFAWHKNKADRRVLQLGSSMLATYSFDRNFDIGKPLIWRHGLDTKLEIMLTVLYEFNGGAIGYIRRFLQQQLRNGWV